MAVAVGLDLAAWWPLRQINALANTPALASALALCWVQPFILPPLFSINQTGSPRLLLTATAGLLAAPLAIAAALMTGLQLGSIVFLIVFAVIGPPDGTNAHSPPGQLLKGAQDLLINAMIWIGVVAGAVTAAVTSVSVATLLPSARPPRVSWWLVGAGAWASVIFQPDWLANVFAPAWREPATLIIAGLPSAIILRWQASRIPNP